MDPTERKQMTTQQQQPAEDGEDAASAVPKRTGGQEQKLTWVDTLGRIIERWVPDAWVICMTLTAIALLLAVLGAGASVEEAALAWGDGVWVLLTLAMQFTIAMVAAHACVASRPVFRMLDALAGLRPQLIQDVEKLPGARILDGQFTAVQQAIGTKPARPAAAAFLREFVEEAKASGLVAELIARHGVEGRLTVAPPA